MESRIGATHRLQREGRWEAASAFRDEVRSKLRKDGLNRSEANQQAWIAMLRKYPPLSDADAERFAFLQQVALADCIPNDSLADRPNEIAMVGAWWVTWTLATLIIAIESSDRDGKAQIAERVRAAIPSRAVYFQAIEALENPGNFISLVEIKLIRLKGRLHASVLERTELRERIGQLEKVLRNLKRATEVDQVREKLQRFGRMIATETTTPPTLSGPGEQSAEAAQCS